jgi:hypothetical protein
MKRILVLVVLTALLSSCSNDNDDGISTELEGKWTLTNVSCFCGFGDNPDFSGHKLIFEGNDLKVENTGEFQFLTNATGSYSVEGSTITLTNGQQYTYVVKPGVLELTFVDEPGIADDEIFLAYIKD